MPFAGIWRAPESLWIARYPDSGEHKRLLGALRCTGFIVAEGCGSAERCGVLRAEAVSRLLDAETDRGSGPALRTIRGATARTEDRHQRLTRLATHHPIGLDGPDVRCPGITFVALVSFVTRGSLRTLRTLSSCRTLRTCDTLYSLSTLGACRSLSARITLGAGVSAASRERKGKADDHRRK
jgi:hypothetical protein